MTEHPIRGTLARDNEVLAYQDFVEMTCAEEDEGVYRSVPSKADQDRNRIRFDEAFPDRSVKVVNTNDQWEAYSVLERYELARREAFGVWHHLSECPYCHTGLLGNRHSDSQFRLIEVRQCAACGWWDTEHHLSEAYVDYGRRSWKSFHRRAVLKSFAVSAADVPVANLCDYINRNPHRAEDVDPYVLEKLVGHVFREIMPCEVRYVGGPGDGGIDLYLVESDVQTAVQVKRRAIRRGPEPVKSVREFLGAMMLENVVRGVFVSTAAFSKSATVAAHKAENVLPFEYIKLVDGKSFADMCGLATRAFAALDLSYPLSEVERNLTVFDELVGFSVAGARPPFA